MSILSNLIVRLGLKRERRVITLRPRIRLVDEGDYRSGWRCSHETDYGNGIRATSVTAPNIGYGTSPARAFEQWEYVNGYFWDSSCADFLSVPRMTE